MKLSEKTTKAEAPKVTKVRRPRAKKADYTFLPEASPAIADMVTEVTKAKSFDAQVARFKVRDEKRKQAQAGIDADTRQLNLMLALAALVVVCVFVAAIVG